MYAKEANQLSEASNTNSDTELLQSIFKLINAKARDGIYILRLPGYELTYGKAQIMRDKFNYSVSPIEKNNILISWVIRW